MGKWISIDSQMPPIGKDVLLSHSTDKWVVVGYRTKAERHWLHGWKVSYWNQFESKDAGDFEIWPTHWVPAPKPPIKF